MAVIYEQIVTEDLHRGFGATSVTNPAGGSLTGTKIGIHSLLGTSYVNPEDFAGGDLGSKIASAVSQIDSGIIDARGFRGAQTISADVVISKRVAILFGDVTISGTGKWYVNSSGVSLLGNGNTVFQLTGSFFGSGSNRALITVGQDSAFNVVAASIEDLEIFGITVDANSLIRCGIRADRVRRLKIHKCVVKGGEGGPLIRVSGDAGATTDSSDVTVQDCWIEDSGNGDAGGTGGDGIYFGGVNRPKAVNNIVFNVTRIGIVTEQNGTVKSADAYIAGNVIHNVHDAGAGQINGAIWLENTDGGIVANNQAYNLTNTPGASSSRGIVIAAGQSAPSTFIVKSNRVDDAQHSFVLGAEADSSVILDGFTIGPSQVTRGISITKGKYFEIANGFFDDRDLQSATAFLVGADLSAAVETIVLRNLTSGAITNTGSGAELSIIGGAFTANRVLASGLTGEQAWRYLQDTATLSRLDVTDSDFNSSPIAGALPASIYFHVTDGTNTEMRARGTLEVRGSTNSKIHVRPLGTGKVGISTTAGFVPTEFFDIDGELRVRTYQDFTRNTTALINGDNNDVSLPSTFNRINGPTAAFAITGIASSAAGRVLLIYNSTAQTMTIKHQNVGSAVANRIVCPTGADETRKFALLVYADVETKWFLLD